MRQYVCDYCHVTIPEPCFTEAPVELKGEFAAGVMSRKTFCCMGCFDKWMIARVELLTNPEDDSQEEGLFPGGIWKREPYGTFDVYPIDPPEKTVVERILSQNKDILEINRGLMEDLSAPVDSKDDD